MLNTAKEQVRLKYADYKRKQPIGIQKGFDKLEQKGKYIVKEGVFNYIRDNCHPEIFENLMRIYKGEKITENMKKKLDTWDKDGRTNERFLIDTVSAWLGEDYILQILFKSPVTSSRYLIRLNGTDNKRMIEDSKDCTREPDIKLIDKITGETLYIEIMEDNTSFVKRKGKFDLRWGGQHSKYESMMNAIDDNSKVSIIILDVVNKGLIMSEIQNCKVLEYKSYNERYNRNSTTLAINHKEHFQKFEGFVLRDN